MNFFADASRARLEITREQARSISNMYKDLSREIAKEKKVLKAKSNVSSILRSQYLSGLSSQINNELNRLATIQGQTIRSNMYRVANATVANNIQFLRRLGFSVTPTMSFIPNSVVTEIATGRLYKGRWNLDAAIWKNTAKNRSDINTIVAKGVAAQKSTYEIAKDLEDYVNPQKRKDWNWAKVYPGTAKVVDYNAQRLARTMISHAYEDSLVKSTKDNPFVDCYRWLTSGSDRTCDICIERAEGFHGVMINGESMDGCYYASDIPLDHPNGMCTIDAVVSQDFNTIGSRIADWVNGETDEALDKFSKSLGYNLQK